MLAQLPDPGSFSAIGWLLAGLVALVVGINQIDDFLKRRRGQPANEELKGSADVIVARVAALEREAAEAMTRRRAMHAKIDDAEKRLREEVRKDTADLHEKINKVDRDVATLTAQNAAQNQHLAHIESKLDRLIERKS